MIRTKKMLSMSLALVTTLALFAGCSKPTANEEKKDEPVTVTILMDGNAFGEKAKTRPYSVLNLKEDFEKENPNIKIEFKALNGADNAEQSKSRSVLMASGDTTDVLYLPNPNETSKYSEAKMILPLEDLAKKGNFDQEKVYGKFLTKLDGKTYFYPSDYSVNVVFYNKKIFDDAGVPYPTGNWTWDDYANIAKKLSNPEKGIYGSLAQNWDYMLYTPTNQSLISAYKKDGTSNFDDPSWKESLKWFNDLQNDGGMPKWLEMNSKKLGWDSFLNGSFGMEFIGAWQMGQFEDLTSYPRDWKVGVAVPPTPKGFNNIPTAGGGWAVNKNSVNPDAAFKVVSYFATQYYKVGGILPPRADMNADELKAILKSDADKMRDVTADELYKVFYDNGMGSSPEKITGPAGAQINDMYMKQAELFFAGKMTLEETMKSIKEKADQFIIQAKDANK